MTTELIALLNSLGWCFQMSSYKNNIVKDIECEIITVNDCCVFQKKKEKEEDKRRKEEAALRLDCIFILIDPLTHIKTFSCAHH